MTKIEELHHIVELLKKHDLPISPILEYCIQERERQYTDEESVPVVCEPATHVYAKDLDAYKWDLSHLSVGSAGGKKLPHKAILLLAIIHQIESGLMEGNEIPLDSTTARAFAAQWNELIPETKYPSVWTPFWYMKSEPFWRFKAVRDERQLAGLLTLGGHPSIGQMRPIIKCACLDDELFTLLKDEQCRVPLKEILISTYVLPFVE